MDKIYSQDAGEEIFREKEAHSTLSVILRMRIYEAESSGGLSRIDDRKGEEEEE